MRSLAAGLGTAVTLWLAWVVLTPPAAEPESFKAWSAARSEHPPPLGPLSHLAAADAQWASARLVGVGPRTSPRRGYQLMRRTGALLVATALGAIALAATLLGATPATAALAVLAAGGTWTFSAHALYPWETAWALPLVALALAAAAAASRSGRRRWIVLAGALSVAAGLVYLAPLAATPAVAWLATGPFGSGRSRRRAAAFIAFCAGVSLAAYAAFTALLWNADHSVWGPLRAYQSLRLEGLFGTPSLGAAAGLPFGWVHALIGLPAWRGARDWLAHGPWFPPLWRLVLAAVIGAGTLGLLAGGTRSARWSAPGATGLWLLAGGMIPPWMWATPTYLKLWTTAMLALPFAVLATDGHTARVRAGTAAGVLALLGATFLGGLVPRFRTPDYTGLAAHWLASNRPGALFVASGWDGFSDELAALEGASVLSLTQMALAPGLLATGREAAVRRVVAAALDTACGRARPVYLVGLASATAADWSPFLGDRVGVPFAVVEWLRRGATPDTSLTVLEPDGERQRVVELSRVPCYVPTGRQPAGRP